MVFVLLEHTVLDEVVKLAQSLQDVLGAPDYYGVEHKKHVVQLEDVSQ